MSGIIGVRVRHGNRVKRQAHRLLFALSKAPQIGNNDSNLSRVSREADWVRAQRVWRSGAFIITLTGTESIKPAMGERGNIMQIGSIVRSVHIAVPQGARGIVMRILGDMAMVAWYAGEPGASPQLNTEPFFLADLIDTGEQVRPSSAQMH
jgi:hypothetical protein